MAKTEQKEERQGSNLLTVLTVCYFVLSVARLVLSIIELRKKMQED
ncbi:MAG: hypothetical protein LUF29_00670 [Oscillospiraceae bacterium]|nr:hypothetical protein [Oscillospiraceae bacterium]